MHAGIDVPYPPSCIPRDACEIYKKGVSCVINEEQQYEKNRITLVTLIEIYVVSIT